MTPMTALIGGWFPFVDYETVHCFSPSRRKLVVSVARLHEVLEKESW